MQFPLHENASLQPNPLRTTLRALTHTWGLLSSPSLRMKWVIDLNISLESVSPWVAWNRFHCVFFWLIKEIIIRLNKKVFYYGQLICLIVTMYLTQQLSLVRTLTYVLTTCLVFVSCPRGPGMVGTYSAHFALPLLAAKTYLHSRAVSSPCSWLWVVLVDYWIGIILNWFCPVESLSNINIAILY